MKVDRKGLSKAWTQERQAARDARSDDDAAKEWAHLERAHIKSATSARSHATVTPLRRR